MTVTIYTKEACMSCDMSKKMLTKKGISYTERPVSDLADQNYMGYQQAPIVVTQNQHWSGFRPDIIKTLV